jgi:hypothetical protein
MSRKATFGAMLTTALLAAMVTGSAWAQGTSTQTLQLTPSRDSGVSGTATLTDTGARVEVQLDVQGLPSAEGTEHLAHIHAGATCADDRAGAGGPVEFPLNSVFNEGGAGASTSTADTTFDELFGGEPFYVNVHAEKTGDAVPPGISCADVVATTVPATGGIASPMTMLLIGGAALVALAAAGGFFVRRRA